MVAKGSQMRRALKKGMKNPCIIVTKRSELIYNFTAQRNINAYLKIFGVRAQDSVADLTTIINVRFP
jgi:hypothetical protein